MDSHGALCLTPDNRALIGELEALPGAYIVGGCNGVGMQHGPGWGKVAAELMINGTTSLTDPSTREPNRFGSKYNSARDVYDHLVPTRRPVAHL